jgi:nucleotide-binding universal stress UspA family protein
VEWAAAEAAARKVPLRIVHAFWIPLLADAFGALSVPPPAATVLGEARDLLDAVMGHALEVAPELTVTTHALGGSPANALFAEGAGTSLLVVGAGKRSRARVRLRTSAVANIADRTRVPLVVVALAEHPSPGPSRGRVVVGVGQAGSSLDALTFAFDAARRRHTGVTAVRAWSPVGSGLPWVELAISESRHREQLARALRPFQDAWPDVDVRQRVLPARASEALFDEAHGASLLVLGSRRRRGLVGQSGQVRRALLRQAHTPVVIVPPTVAPGR